MIYQELRDQNGRGSLQIQIASDGSGQVMLSRGYVRASIIVDRAQWRELAEALQAVIAADDARRASSATEREVAELLAEGEREYEARLGGGA
jgi:hypothetical protein